MMKLHEIMKFSLLFVALLLSACSGAPAASTAAPTLDATGLVTMVAQTLQAQYTQTALSQPTATSVPQLPPTATLLPTVQPQESPTSFSLPTVVLTTPTSKPVVSGGTAAPAPAAVPALFAVTSVVTSVNNAGFSTACPPGYTFYFSATITANGPGRVTYDWEFSNGTKSDVQTLEYTSAGSQVVTTSWAMGEGDVPVGSTYKGWARITINDPNHQVFPRASFTMQCTP